jgi:hypothetical protein
MSTFVKTVCQKCGKVAEVDANAPPPKVSPTLGWITVLIEGVGVWNLCPACGSDLRIYAALAPDGIYHSKLGAKP